MKWIDMKWINMKWIDMKWINMKWIGTKWIDMKWIDITIGTQFRNIAEKHKDTRANRSYLWYPLEMNRLKDLQIQ